MGDYILKNYQQGVEADHARIGIRVALNWLWPLAHDQEDWQQINAQPGFDPDTRLYCFLAEEMVGCLFWQINPQARENPQQPLSTSRGCYQGTKPLLKGCYPTPLKPSGKKASPAWSGG